MFGDDETAQQIVGHDRAEMFNARFGDAVTAQRGVAIMWAWK